MAATEILLQVLRDPIRLKQWTARVPVLLQLCGRMEAEFQAQKVLAIVHPHSQDGVKVTTKASSSTTKYPIEVSGTTWKDIQQLLYPNAKKNSLTLPPLSHPDVELKWTREKGYGLYARRSIRKGNSFWSEEPFVYSSVNEGRCFQCAKSVTQPSQRISCLHCTCEWYCSTECREKSWTSYHRSLCNVDYREEREMSIEHAYSLTSRLQLLIFKLLGWTVNHQDKLGLGNFQPTEGPSLDALGQLFKDLQKDEKIGESTSSTSSPSLTPFSSLPDPWVQNWIYNLHLTASAGRPRTVPFPLIYSRCQEFQRKVLSKEAAWSHPQILNPCDYIAMLDICTLYAFSVFTNEDEKKGGLPAGVALYRNSGFANHSCVPNTEWGMQPNSNVIQFKANRTIQAGEEILICYILPNQTFANRQASLHRYGFRCTCQRCLLEASQQLIAK